MPAIDKLLLQSALCPPLHGALVSQLLDEFVSQERRFVLRDWEPATLDGGQFAEAAARILYHIDSGTLGLSRSVDMCLKYVEDEDRTRTHAYPNRKSALHTAKVLRTIYKFRSDRGAVHIALDYTANHLDSKLVIEGVRWVLSEVLRVFWTGDRDAVAHAIREILTYDVPVIGRYEDRLMIHRTDCSAEEEVLILLHHAGEAGLSRTELGRYVGHSAPSVTRAVQALGSTRTRQITKLSSGNYRLTDLGVKRVTTALGDKLVAL